MSDASATVERDGRSAVVRLHGDVALATAGTLYNQLRTIGRRRDVSSVIVDLSDVARLDSAGIAVLALVGRQLERAGKTLEIRAPSEHHRAALALEYVQPAPHPESTIEEPTALERVGDRMNQGAAGVRALAALVGETVRQA